MSSIPSTNVPLSWNPGTALAELKKRVTGEGAYGNTPYYSLQLQGGFLHAWKGLTACFQNPISPSGSNTQDTPWEFSAYTRETLPSINLNALTTNPTPPDEPVLTITLPERRDLSGTKTVPAKRLAITVQDLVGASARTVQERGFRAYATQIIITPEARNTDHDNMGLNNSDLFYLSIDVQTADQSWTSLACRTLGMAVGGDWPRVQWPAHALALPSTNEETDKDK